MARLILGVLILFYLTGCSIIVENADDVYLVEANKYMDSHDILMNFRYDTGRPVSEVKDKFNDQYKKVKSITEGLKSLSPPAKLASDHEQLVKAFEDFEKFYGAMNEYIQSAKEDRNTEIRIDEYEEIAESSYNSAVLTKPPYRKKGDVVK